MTKVSVETVDAVRRRLAVEVPASEVTAEIERAYEQLRRTASVRGFRPGRAPRAVLEQLFGDRLRADVFEKLVRESFSEAVREKQIEPVGQPEIVTERAEPGEPLRYSATVEVKPAIIATGYNGLEVERPFRPVTERDVDAYLESLRQSLAQLRPVTDRTRAMRGDVATVDYEARADHRLLGRAENRRIAVEADAADSLGAHLEGAEIGGSVEFAIDYPPEHANPELAGRRVDFRVHVKALALKEVPGLDDEFAKDHGECETLAELRERVRLQLQAAAAEAADGAARAACIAQLLRVHDVEMPRAMVAHRADALAADFLDSLGPRRPPASREEEVRARVRAELEPRARDQVKAALILEAIAAQEHIAISDAELDAQIERLAERAGAGGCERVRALYRDPSARMSLRGRLLQERALDLVLERARVRTVEHASSVADGEGNR